MATQKTTTDQAPAATTTSNKEGGFHLPGISTFGNAIQSLKETLGLEEGKSADGGDTKAPTTTSDAQSTGSQSEAAASTTKKEGTFSLPTLATFDNAIQSLKGTLGLDETKPNTNANNTQPESSNKESGANQSDAASTTTKKEGGFSLPSFDSTLQSIKGTLGLDDAKNESSQPDAANSTAKKESGFSLPSIPSFDSTLQSIKDTLGLDAGKQDESAKPQQSTTTDTNTTTAQPESSTAATKKEGGFSLPTIPLFDNAVQSIRETLKIDDTKRDEKPKSDSPSASPEKKEGGFSLPSISSLDDKFKSIRETLGIDHIKSELLGKPQQPSSSGSDQTKVESEAASPAAKA